VFLTRCEQRLHLSRRNWKFIENQILKNTTILQKAKERQKIKTLITNAMLMLEPFDNKFHEDSKHPKKTFFRC